MKRIFYDSGASQGGGDTKSQTPSADKKKDRKPGRLTGFETSTSTGDGEKSHKEAIEKQEKKP